MRVTVLILVVLVGVLGAPATSFAEKVRTNSKAKVYNRPGEQGKIVVRVKEGQAMTVLAKEGRWVKVRVSGRTGFIPRSYLDMPAGDDEIVRNTRRRPFVDGRSTKRSFGGSAPDDRIGEDATEDHGSMDEADSESDEADTSDDEEDVKPEKKEKKPKKVEKASKADKEESEDEEEESTEGSDEDEPTTEEEEEVKDERQRARVSEKTIIYSEPDKKSDKQFTATPKDTLFVESKKGKWTEVSVEEGDIGWILSSKLDMEGDDDSGDEGGGGSKKRMIETRARLGFRLVSQRLTSTGGTMSWPDNYKIGSSAAAISLGGSVLFPYKKDFLVGGGIDYDLAYAIPGIAFDPDGPAEGSAPGGTTSFTMHNLRIRGIGGYNFHKKNGLVALAKLGLHYESFMVANNTDLVKNTARLPSEVIKGPSLGLAVAIPRLTEKVGLTINIDAILFGGSVTQTKNLEDGQNPSVKRYTVSGIVNYEYSKGFDLNFGYDMNYASLTFGAPIASSMRMHTGTGAARTDLNHTVSAGISKTF